MRRRHRHLAGPLPQASAGWPASPGRGGRRRPSASRRPGCAPSPGRTRRPARSPPATPSGSRRQSSRVIARIVVACSLRLQNAAKSCSPTSPAAAAFSRSRSSGRSQPRVSWRRSGSGAPRRVGDPVLVAPERRREPGVEVGRHRRRPPAPGRPAAAARPAGAAATPPSVGPARRRAGRRGRPGRWRAPRRRCARPRSGRAASGADEPAPAPRRAPRRRYAGRAGRPSRRSRCRRTTTSSRSRIARPSRPYRAIVDRQPYEGRPGTPTGCRARHACELRPWRRSPSASSPGRRRPCRRTRSPAPRRPGRPAAAAGVSSSRASASTLSCCAAALRAGLLGRRRGGRDLQLLDQLDDRHRSGVTLARAGLDDPGVATRPVGVPRRDLLEQGVHDVLVLHDGQHPATGVQVAALGLGDELLGQRAQPLGLRLGGLDLPVPEELGGQVGQDAASRARGCRRGGDPWWAWAFRMLLG